MNRNGLLDLLKQARQSGINKPEYKNAWERRFAFSQVETDDPKVYDEPMKLLCNDPDLVTCRRT